MAVAFVAGMSSPGGFSARTSFSNAITFTTTSGAGNLLAVALLFPADPGAFTSVTYNSVAMTAAGSTIVNSTSAVAIYYMLNPGAGNLTLGASWTNSVAISWVAGEFSGVNTTTPVASANYTTNTGSSTAESVTVPTTSGDAAFAAYANSGVGNQATSSQTSIADGSWVGGSGSMDAAYGLASGSSVAFSWTNFGSASAWAAAGIDIVAAGGGGASFIPYTPWPQMGPMVAQKRKQLGWTPFLDPRRRVRRPQRALLVPSRHLLVPRKAA